VIPDGRRGYVLQRDLIQEAPAAFRLRQLEAEIERQAEEIGQLRKDNAELSAAANAQADREAQIKAELERLQSERSQIEYTRNLSWFLAGAGVLLTGWLIGWRFKLRDRTRGQGLRFS
jgi:SH3 domain protein